MASTNAARGRPRADPPTGATRREIRAAGGDGQRGLDGRRAGFAGGIWLLVLYALSTALFVMSHAPGSGLFPLWDGVLPGFDGSSNWGIALGFPLSFVYGAGGAWLFALIYNIAPARTGKGRETT